jgi:hypothetical protein
MLLNAPSSLIQSYYSLGAFGIGIINANALVIMLILVVSILL